MTEEDWGHREASSLFRATQPGGDRGGFAPGKLALWFGSAEGLSTLADTAVASGT